MHVDDLAKACIFVLENWSPTSTELNYLNVGTGQDITIRETADLIANLCHFKGNIRWDSSKPDGTPKKLLDITRISSLGWQPSISLVDGLRTTIDEYKCRCQS